MHQTAATKAGRKLISTFVGENGNNIIDSCKVITTHLDGADAAKKNKERIFRFALKVKLMFDDGLVKPKDTLHMIDQLDQLLAKFVKLLKGEKKGAEEAVMVITNSVDRLAYEVIELVGKHMQKKNQEKLKGLFTYYGSKKFLSCLAQNKEVVQQKKTILDNLIPLVRKQAPHLCKSLGIPREDEKQSS